MKRLKQFLFITTLTGLFISCAQSDRLLLGEDYAKEQLKMALIDTLREKVLVDTIISNQETAINISEAILFKAYGKDNIIKQRPYEVYRIDNHWIISGTLPSNSEGGTFLIILRAKDNKVIRLTHGK